MRVERIAYFVEAGRAGSLRAAADRLGVAQSLLGEQIRALEEELDVVLLHRSSRGVSLTSAGQRLFPHALNLLEAQRELIDAAVNQGRSISGQVRISTVPLLTTTVLAQLLTALRDTYPGVHVSIEETSARDQLEQSVRQGVSDFALITTPGVEPDHREDPTVHRRMLARLPVAACVPTVHPLASRSRLTWAEISSHELVSMRAGTTLEEILRHHVDRPRLVAEVANLYSLTALVGRGLGIGVGVPADFLDRDDAIRWVPIDGQERGLAVQISSRRGTPMPRAASAVREAIISRVSEVEKIGDAWTVMHWRATGRA